MRLIIDCLYLLAIVLISPKVVYRMVRRRRYLAGWGQRLGNVSRQNPAKKCIWIHAVSVGEVNSTKTLVAALAEAFGDHEIVISATTDTGLARAHEIYGDDLAVFYFPFDLSFVMGRAFDNLRPDICLLMELEVWPNLARIAKDRNIPVVVVNGRLSDKSYPLYRLVRPLAKRMFAKVSLVLAQTQEYAGRFIALGCPENRVTVTSSLKYDTADVGDIVAGADELAARLNIGDEPLWIAGGTGPGEEKIVLEAFAELKRDQRFADLRVAIIPRKPERFDETAALIEQSGFNFARYSGVLSGQCKVQGRPEVILGDTMGDLKKFYSLATIVFVGRTLTPMGGSDMMEPTAMGKCTIFGPHTFNFKQTVDALLAGKGAIEVKDGPELYETIKKCLTDANFAKTTAENGAKVIKQNQGATKQTIEAISALLASQHK
ncbi:MAG: 3-deoxy-D-manno-octulosonic acid transferase [Planctomycetes bacterium]|nr:3-deoxy-D-manno-octulosonic acid transferase [Planctomycetota bacterium]